MRSEFALIPATMRGSLTTQRGMRRARLVSAAINTQFVMPMATANSPKTTPPAASVTMPTITKNSPSRPRRIRIVRRRPMSPAPIRRAYAAVPSARDEHPHASRLVTLAAGTELEFDLLALFEAAIAVAFDGREVDENVGVPFAFDEPESLAGVEPLDGAARPVRVDPGRESGDGGRGRRRWRDLELPPTNCVRSQQGERLRIGSVETATGPELTLEPADVALLVTR